MATMWWHRNVFATSTSAYTHSLSTQALHQRFHCYVPRHEFVRGVNKYISELPL